MVERLSDTRGWSCHPLMGPRTTSDSTFDTRARHEASIVFPPASRAHQPTRVARARRRLMRLMVMAAAGRARRRHAVM